MTDKQKARAVSAYLAQMREDCRTAAGAALIAGLPEVGKALAYIASAPLDKLLEMRYNSETMIKPKTDSNTRGD